MPQLLVRNRVEDYDRWLGYFESEKPAARDYGMEVVGLWRATDDPNDIYFLFELESIERANAFMARPESAKVGELSGVIDGEIRFLESAPVGERP